MTKIAKYTPDKHSKSYQKVDPGEAQITNKIAPTKKRQNNMFFKQNTIPKSVPRSHWGDPGAPQGAEKTYYRWGLSYVWYF